MHNYLLTSLLLLPCRQKKSWSLWFVQKVQNIEWCLPYHPFSIPWKIEVVSEAQLYIYKLSGIPLGPPSNREPMKQQIIASILKLGQVPNYNGKIALFVPPNFRHLFTKHIKLTYTPLKFNIAPEK